VAKSMTGFGLAETGLPLGKVVVEVRCLNHRYLDIALKLPKGFFLLEPRIRDLVKQWVARGRVDLHMRIERSVASMPRYVLEPNVALAEEYISRLQEMKGRFDLAGEVSVDHIAGVPQLLSFLETEEQVEPHEKELIATINDSLQSMDEFRHTEGQALVADLIGRVGEIRKLLGEIKQRIPIMVESYRERLRQRIRVLLEGSDLDELRFNQEMAYFADRSDISEEVVRMESHLDQFESKLREEEPVGRRLDFVVQEMNREINTIGAKANDSLIAQLVIEMKNELGSVREQVQNIE